MVSKVMAKLKFDYPLKQDLPICDGSLIFIFLICLVM
jgi:hypothetical protein